MSLRDPYTKLILIAATFLVVCAMLAAAAFAATPAFSVHKNGTAQTVVGDTPTKLTWSNEVIDTNANFATDRFTPTVPGNYLIVVSVQCAQPGACVPAIYKNGTLYAASRITSQTFADQSPQATAIVSMNGSTDFVEAFATSAGTSIGGTATQTYFSGSQIDGSGSGGSGNNTMTAGWPDAIKCNVTSPAFGTTILYSQVMPYPADGDYWYSSDLASNAYRLKFNADGTFDSYQGSLVSTSDCGVSIPALYAANKAFNFVGGASASAAGSAGQVQFNEGGTLQADAGLNWDNANKRLGIGTSAPLSQLTVRRLPNTGPIEFRLGANEASARDLIIRKDTSTPYETHFISSAHPTSDAGALRFFTSDQPSGERMVIGGNGNVGIGTASPGAMLHISGASPRIYLTDTDNGADSWINADGSVGAIAIVADQGNEVANSSVILSVDGSERVRINDVGNVGIGTISPQRPLDVAASGTSYGQGGYAGGTAAIFRSTQSTGSNSRVSITSGNAGASIIDFGDTDGDRGSIQYLHNGDALALAVNAAERMRIDSSGNVGIGTTAPNQLLEVRGNGARLRLATASGPTTYFFDIESNYASANTVNMYAGTVNLLKYIANDLSLNLMPAGGNVGIGTTNPLDKIHVYNGGIRVQKAGTTGAVFSSETGYNQVYSYNAEPLYLGGGNVGIGTTAPASLLHVHKASGGSYAYITNDGATATDHSNVWFATNYGTSPNWAGIGIYSGDGKLRLTGSQSLATPGMTIDDSNNVGIGTTTPAAKLQVAGNIRLDSPVNATAGRTVCMNVNGDFHAVSASTCYASDERLKTNIKNLPQGQLEEISKLRGVSYEWKSPKDWRPGEQIGLIAQEVEKVYPQVVNTGSDGRKSVDYQWLVAPIIEAVKELKAANDNQAREIEALRDELDALKAAR